MDYSKPLQVVTQLLNLNGSWEGQRCKEKTKVSGSMMLNCIITASSSHLLLHLLLLLQNSPITYKMCSCLLSVCLFQNPDPVFCLSISLRSMR